jgi:hypothetical protein
MDVMTGIRSARVCDRRAPSGQSFAGSARRGLLIARESPVLIGAYLLRIIALKAKP